MRNLSGLSPAETLLLTQGKKVPIKDLLKVTMMDLLLKQILRTVELPANVNEVTSPTNTYVLVGNNFSTTKPLNHEKVFLSSFERETKAEVLFINLVKIGYQKAGSEKSYNKLIRDSPGLAGCFGTGFSSIFNPFQRSDYGLRVASELKRHLETLSNTLPQLIENDPEKALEVLKQIKGNVFLVKGIDFKRMAEIENTVLSEIYSSQSVSNNTFADPVTWLALDFSSRKFDSSSGCSGVDFSDSGGDSGCSGDSGCGGD